MDETYIHITASYVEGTMSDDRIYDSVGHPNSSGSGLGRRDMEWVFLSSEHVKAAETKNKLNDIPGLTVWSRTYDVNGNIIT